MTPSVQQGNTMMTKWAVRFFFMCVKVSAVLQFNVCFGWKVFTAVAVIDDADDVYIHI